ncbi:MAG: cytochrome P450 [Anaerolineaceae bacterium]|nr:cytochrome P450 [Anaerolineaceae bacterium]
MPIIPTPTGLAGLHALRQMWRERSVLGALTVFNRELGNIFRLSLPGFDAVMLVGAEAARFVLVSGRNDLRWRMEGDPVTMLLRHGVLVEDGDSHDQIRRSMNPALHKQMLQTYIESMWRGTDQVMARWHDGAVVDMLPEMRRIALLVLLDTLFKVDFTPDMDRLWRAILKTLSYISPGLWMFSSCIPRLGYADGLRQMDDYLYQMIRLRRARIGEPTDLLGLLVSDPNMDDNLIRDQLLTMLIAGHDTSTALLSWTLYLLGKHPDIMQQAQAEVRTILGDQPPTFDQLRSLPLLDQIIDESLRLYPPIHLGSRRAAQDLDFSGYQIPSGTRVMYSIYVTHRMPEYWDAPDEFRPRRFAPAAPKPAPYTYLPFGGGPRNCIGAAYAQVEAKVILARILQRRILTLSPRRVHAYMGATLEPRPGVFMTTHTA